MLQIRLAKHEDIDMLRALSISVWLSTYAKAGINNNCAKYVLKNFSEKQFTHWLNCDQFRLFLAEFDGVIKGFILINTLPTDDEYEQYGFEIDKLYVSELFRGQGVGKQLIQHMQQKFGAACWLYTWVENESNHFYQKIGMKKVGLKSFYFADELVTNHVYSIDCLIK